MIARTAYLDSEVGYHLFDVCALYTFIFFPVFSKKQCSLLDVLAKQIKFSMLDQAILWLCSQMSKRNISGNVSVAGETFPECKLRAVFHL